RTRIAQLCDTDTFEEFNADLVSTDPLEWTDSKAYADRQSEARAKTGLTEAVLTGRAYIKGRPTILAVMDPFFIMGSMGAVVGEKVTAAIERATDDALPIVIVTCSGGA